MVTVHFKPGPSKLLVAAAIKKALQISIGDARDAVEIGRIKCEQEDREKVVKAIEAAGAKLT